MHFVSTTNTWTVCIHFSSTASVAKLLSRVDNSLIICRGQFNSTSKTKEGTECPASRKRDSSGKSTKNICTLYKEILSFFGHCLVTIPYMEPLSFFGRFVQKVRVSFFQIHLFRKRRNRKERQRKGERTYSKMAAVMLQVILSFYTNYSKNSFFISANTYEKYIVCKEYCIARHDDKMCFLPNCRYHIILLGNIKELLQNLYAFCFN